MAKRSAINFAGHEVTIYAKTLAYRGLFAPFPFAIHLAVVSFLRVDTILGWLAEQGPPEIRGRVLQPVESLLGQVLEQNQGALLVADIVLVFWPVSMGVRSCRRR